MNVHEERQKKLLEWATLSQVLYQSPSQYSLGVPVQQAAPSLTRSLLKRHSHRERVPDSDSPPRPEDLGGLGVKL